MSAAQFALAALPAFAASLVEFVEALTIVLAVGATSGWRPALGGAAAAVVLLVVAVAGLGSALTLVPERWFEAIVGALLLVFGLRWLRKAVLHAAGRIPLHDEARAYAQTTSDLTAQRSDARLRDWSAATTSFNGVALEGAEVAFIVIALGKSGPALLAASAGAAAAFAVVIALGIAVHRPLLRVPENALKMLVGIMLSALGTFWLVEGIGGAWPGGDAAILGLIVAYAALAFGASAILRRRTTA